MKLFSPIFLYPTCLIGAMMCCRHTVQHSLSQLCAVMVKHETPDCWPALLQLLNESTKSSNAKDRQVLIHLNGFCLASSFLVVSAECFFY